MNRLMLLFMSKTRLLVLLIAVLNVVHPFIHGTLLDGGGLDASLTYLDCWAMSTWGINE